MPKTPSGKQTNTLFSYFKKTPKQEDSNHKTPNETKGVLSQRKSPNTEDKTKNSFGLDATKEERKECDVVWAKLEGYPWWPALVCNHPTQNCCVKEGKNPQVHVQFFDQPPNRAWVKAKYAKPYNGSDDPDCQRGGPYFSYLSKIHDGSREADKALAMSPKDRLSLVVELQPSSEEEDDEDDEEDHEKMDFDPSIFDAEMSENEEESPKNSTEKKSTSSPVKITKSKRKAAKEAVVKSKRRKISRSESADEDSEEDFKPEDDGEDEDEDSLSSGVDENEASEPETASEPDSPVKQPIKRKKTDKSTAKRSIAKSSPSEIKSSPVAVSANTKSRLSLFAASEMSKDGGESSVCDVSSFPHTKLDFMQPEKIRDSSRKNKDDPDYNPRTLYVPDSFLNKQTPAMRQWWELKSNHLNTVLFFKVGKFYELYHMDAVVGVTELGLIYMKGDWAHSGFPEIAYTRYAEALVQKGYKVARVEQTETPDMMNERCRNMGRMASKYDKVVKREVCQINSQAIRIYNHMEGVLQDANNSYILALCEKETAQEGLKVFGVCFIDTSIGTFHVGQFEDDRHLSRMRTLIAHYPPTQVLYEKGKVSSQILQLLNVNLATALKESLNSGTEFWDSGKTLKTLMEEDYFKNEDDDETKIEWPEVLKSMVSKSDTLGLTAAEPYDLAIRSLGAVTWYLQYCLVDHDMLSAKRFEEYKPVDNDSQNTLTKSKSLALDVNQQHMVLDGVTMNNLDIVTNSQTGTVEGTLLEKLNMCSTAFGKRLFHQWLCAPLCQPASINDRLDAIEDLLGVPSIVDESVVILKKLPDLERLLGRIHTIGLARRNKSHPDTRAILYEEMTYSKRKIEDFLTTIDGFKSCVTLVGKFKSDVNNFKSKILSRSLSVQSTETHNSHFPDISEDLDFFNNAFDHKKAKKDGVIVPSKGVDDEYDTAFADIAKIESKLGDYLDAQKKILKCHTITYWGTGKNRYQMEVPEAFIKNVPLSYELMSSKKGTKRYRTTEINELLEQLMDAEERKDSSLKDVMRRIFHSFDERHSKWLRVVECMAVLDVLISLNLYSRGGEVTLCRPEFIALEDGVEPMLEIRQGHHPCVSKTFDGGDFIPNDTLIGLKDEMDDEDQTYSLGKTVVVTGPNMGGKSTLMRQAGLIVIMAQIGCYVPAEKCRLTPVDRIFTRLGASDRIMAGESTFYVELSETSSILQHATKHSLILMDELGRGTATYDGTAIASSVVKTLCEEIQCRTLFSTHYYSLVEEFRTKSDIQLGHMACMVENECDDDPSQETITFLYKFVKGACPKSYGFNAARLAGIVEEVIQSAIKKAGEFEHDVEKKKLFRNLWNCEGDDDLMTLLSQVAA